MKNRLRDLRKSQNLSQAQIAQVVGVVKSAICQYENGTRQMPDETKLQLADFFNVSVDYLLGRTETPGFSQNQSIDITPAEERYLTQAEDDLVETFREIGKQKGAEVQNLAQRLLNQLLEQ